MVESNIRKASEIIVDLEVKVDKMLGLIQSLEYNIRLLSNKVSLLEEKLEKSNPIPKFSIEQANVKDTPTETYFSPEEYLKVDEAPTGFRRTSRPETFSNVPFMQQPQPTKKPPSTAEILVKNQEPTPPNVEVNTQKMYQNTIPTIQRVVDRNGKSVFLADVEILDTNTNNLVLKTKTNGTGKWMASLPIGDFKVILKKRNPISKEKEEVVQPLHVDGSKSPLELQTLIFKI